MLDPHIMHIRALKAKWQPFCKSAHHSIALHKVFQSSCQWFYTDGKHTAQGPPVQLPQDSTRKDGWSPDPPLPIGLLFGEQWRCQ